MMMGLEKEDLGLSLGLGCAVDRRPLQLGLMPASTSSSPSYFAQPRPSPWSQIFAAAAAEKSSDLYMGGGETRPFLRGIDVNRSPLSSSAAADNNDEEAALSSPNSTVSSVSGKRSVADAGGGGGDEHDGERDSSSRAAAVSDEEDGEGSRKKLRLTKDQSAVLEESFKEHNTLNPKQKLALAKQLNLRPRQVEVWFQNRRARTKLKQTEVDCEYLKRCCESLTEENRRLQKEVQELRALKLSPQLYMQMAPPTTLTMCPSCERVAVSAAAAAAGDNHHHHHHHQQKSQAARPVATIPSWGRPSPLRVFDAPPHRA